MAIQFRCPGCQQPIEVDDIHAGQTAACPYCRRVVNVPAESSLEPLASVTARPPAGATDDERLGSPELRVPPAPVPPVSPALGELHVGPLPSARDLRARSFGNYALVCTVLSVLLFVVLFAATVKVALDRSLLSSASRPTQEQMAQLETEIGRNPWIGTLNIGGLFFACVGLALGITSLVQSRRNNWRGMVSVVLCGLLMLCVCSAAALSVASGLGAPA